MSRSSTKAGTGFGIFRIVGLSAILIGLSQFLIGGCGGGGSSSGYYVVPKSKPKATIEVVAPIAESAEVDTSNLVDVFKVTLSKTGKSDVTVVFTVDAASTATLVDDYDLTTGTGENSVVIPAGSTEAFITVSANGDTVEEGGETVIITLVDGNDYDLGTPAEASVTIVDEDVPNTEPVANDDAYAMDQGTTLDIVAAGVLDNDDDIDLDPLTAVLDTDVAGGSLTLNADGSFSYTPAVEFYGDMTFTYLANDGAADSLAAATVTITVNRVNTAPVAVDDDYSVAKNTDLVVAAAGVLVNDDDPDGYPDPLTAVIQTSPASGLVTLNADGSFTYTPATDFNGVDSFTYMAFDGESYSNEATVTITINAPPVAPDREYTFTKKTSQVSVNLGLLSPTQGASDADGDPLTITIVDQPVGSLTVNPDGSFTYKSPTKGNVTPPTDMFTYTVNDGTTDSNLGTVLINLNIVPAP